jgi:mRNA interferase MazF
MKRGDFVTIVQLGDFGKPRPALVIQSDLFNDIHPTVTVLLVSSLIVIAPLIRITVEPNEHNGLKKTSQIQIDKIMTIKREKIGQIIGQASDTLMLSITRALAVFLGFV